MRASICAALLLLGSAPALAEGPAPTVPPAKKQPKVKNYEFSGLDVEGKLKTPQLLYFLHRMDAEFDQTAPAKRSFLPELRRSAADL